MLALEGFTPQEKLYESSQSVVFRGESAQYGPSIAKQLRAPFPTLEQRAGFRREFALVRSLECDGVAVAYALARHQQSLAILLEDFGGRSLDHWLAEGPLSLNEGLSIGVRLCEMLDHIHEAGVVHKDLNPSNIVWNRQNDILKLIDFGIASRLSRETQSYDPARALEGTLAYISPEQTGRMNRSVDVRSDLYSLGCTLYELFTGAKPFAHGDPMEQVHAHIAMTPTPPHIQRPELPESLSAIILKLMAKAAESRYQSALGLRADLAQVQRALETSEATSCFALGECDFPRELRIPQKLYGRQAELGTLQEAFERAAEGAKELVLVSGAAGVGKSALVQELQQNLAASGHRFLAGSGKCEQYKRQVPYHSIIEALGQLLDHRLSLPEDEFSAWRQAWTELLGPNAQLVIDVLPELGVVLGPQPPVSELPPTESMHRFGFVLQQFASSFASPEQPLLLWLDDLQWIDAASLQLLSQLMLAPEVKHICVIGAFREEEIGPTHRLVDVISTLEQSPAIALARLHVDELRQEHTHELCEETFRSSPEEFAQAVALCHQKTGGNPFYLHQFIESFYAEGGVQLESETQMWRWDLDALRAMETTENVVELMVRRLQRLEATTRELLKLASLLGHRFALSSLRLLWEGPEDELLTALTALLEEGLLVPLTGDYKFVGVWEGIDVTYRFLHDRVQQAAYSLLTETERRQQHLRMGRLLQDTLSPTERDERLFEVVDHWNESAAVEEGAATRHQLASWNLEAGQKAKAAAAHDAADRYLSRGLQLLEPDDWEDQYELAFRLHIGAAEAAYLRVDFARSEQLAAVALKHAASLLDQIEVYHLNIQAYKAANELRKAVDTTLQALELLGESFPKRGTMMDILVALSSLKWRLRGQHVDQLYDRPPMSDPHKVQATHLLINILDVAYTASPQLFPLFNIRVVELTVRYGPCPEVPTVYACYGIMLCGVLGDIEGGLQFGQLSLRLYERYEARPYLSKLLMVLNAFILHWTRDLRETLPPLQRGYHVGLEHGDVEYALICLYIYGYHALLAGTPLDALERDYERYTQQMLHYQQETYLANNQIFWQTIVNLRHSPADPTRLCGDIYDDEEMEAIHKETQHHTALYCLSLNRLYLRYLFGDYEGALRASKETEQYLTHATGSALIPRLYLFDALTRAALCEGLPWHRRWVHLRKIKARLKRFERWAVHAPSNYRPVCSLLQAELARLTQSNARAMSLYDEAINGAKQTDNLEQEALSSELAARFYQGLGQRRQAQLYYRDAHYAYRRWGAGSKVKALEQQLPFLQTLPTPSQQGTHSTLSTSQRTAAEKLDLHSIMKSVQAISSQMSLQGLLYRLMEISIENAGAQRGYLLLERQEQLWLEGMGSHQSHDVQVLQSVPLHECQELPQAIIAYVWRSREPLVLRDASTEGAYMAEAVVVQRGIKSVLCLPLLDQRRLLGVFYFENNLIEGAFSPGHQTALQIIASQAVISLENARLYTSLEDQVKERTKELHLALEQREAAFGELQHTHTQLAEKHTELKQTQAQLIQAEKMASLGTLVAGIAHELNNPASFASAGAFNLQRKLTSLQELIDELAGEDAPAELRALFERHFTPMFESVTSIQEGARRIDQIVSSLRTFSRLDQADQKSTRIVENIRSALLPVHANFRHQVQVHEEFAFDPLVDCWPALLNQVFLNVLLNACQAIASKAPDQEGTGHLWLRTFERDGQLGIEFEDDGCGIPEAVLPNVFEPFFTTKDVGGGRGLGLSIAFGNIEKHHGSIELRSHESQGTTVTILLPLSATDRADAFTTPDKRTNETHDASQANDPLAVDVP